MFTFLEELLLSQFVGVVYPESALTGLENKKVTRGPSPPCGGLTCPAGRVWPGTHWRRSLRQRICGCRVWRGKTRTRSRELLMPGQLAERWLQPGIEQISVTESLLVRIFFLTIVSGRVWSSESDLLDLTEMRENFNISTSLCGSCSISPSYTLHWTASDTSQVKTRHCSPGSFVALGNLKQIADK